MSFNKRKIFGSRSAAFPSWFYAALRRPTSVRQPFDGLPELMICFAPAPIFALAGDFGFQWHCLRFGAFVYSKNFFAVTTIRGFLLWLFDHVSVVWTRIHDDDKDDNNTSICRCVLLHQAFIVWTQIRDDGEDENNTSIYRCVLLHQTFFLGTRMHQQRQQWWCWWWRQRWRWCQDRSLTARITTRLVMLMMLLLLLLTVADQDFLLGTRRLRFGSRSTAFLSWCYSASQSGCYSAFPSWC